MSGAEGSVQKKACGRFYIFLTVVMIECNVQWSPILHPWAGTSIDFVWSWFLYVGFKKL